MKKLRPNIERMCLALAVFTAVATPAHAAGGGGPVQIVLGGPAILLLCLSALAVVYLAAAVIRKQEGLVTLAHNAAALLGKGPPILTIWGLLAAILLLSAFAVLSKNHNLGALVILLVLMGMALVGMGAGVAAYAAGRRLHGELSGGEIDAVSALGLGLRLFFVAVALPVAGWIVVALVTAGGIGSVLAAIVQGEPEQDID